MPKLLNDDDFESLEAARPILRTIAALVIFVGSSSSDVDIRSSTYDSAYYSADEFLDRMMADLRAAK